MSGCPFISTSIDLFLIYNVNLEEGSFKTSQLKKIPLCELNRKSPFQISLGPTGGVVRSFKIFTIKEETTRRIRILTLEQEMGSSGAHP